MRSKGLIAARRQMRWTLPGVIVCAAVLGVVAPAQGGFPGKPGMIVFSSTFTGDREIFITAADGSLRTDLTRDPHADITPSGSADGKRIAFASDRSGAIEMTNEGNVAFSPDGKYAIIGSGDLATPWLLDVVRSFGCV